LTWPPLARACPASRQVFDFSEEPEEEEEKPADAPALEGEAKEEAKKLK
jgi:hypothetical protein